MEIKRFAFSTRAFSRHDLPAALNYVAGAGFSGVEILADKPHAWLDRMSIANQERLLRQIGTLGLFVSNIDACTSNGFWSDAPSEPLFDPSLVSRSRELREWRVAYVKKALRFGKAAGAGCVTLTSGKALDGVPPEQAFKHLYDNLNRLVEYGEKIGQKLALKCEPGHVIENTADLAELIRSIGSRFVGATFDLGVAEVRGESIRYSLSKLDGSLFNVQLADIRSRKYYRRAPGEGSFDFAGIFKLLEAAGFGGPLTWNLPGYDENPEWACKRAFQFCKTGGSGAATPPPKSPKVPRTRTKVKNAVTAMA